MLAPGGLVYVFDGEDAPARIEELVKKIDHPRRPDVTAGELKELFRAAKGSAVFYGTGPILPREYEGGAEPKTYVLWLFWWRKKKLHVLALLDARFAEEVPDRRFERLRALPYYFFAWAQEVHGFEFEEDLGRCAAILSERFLKSKGLKLPEDEVIVVDYDRAWNAAVVFGRRGNYLVTRYGVMPHKAAKDTVEDSVRLLCKALGLQAPEAPSEKFLETLHAHFVAWRLARGR